MSAALKLVEKQWMGPVAVAAAAVEQNKVEQRDVEQRKVEQRKAPHRLRLVQAMAVGPVGPVEGSQAAVPAAAPEVELAFYRKYTEGMLDRYMRLSMETGRVPSLLGQEMFRGHVTRGKVKSFEDVVIFVHDVENCLKELDTAQQYLLRRIALQGHTQQEVSGMTGMSLRTVIRRYWEGLDALTKLLLDRRLMEPALAGGLL